MIEIDIPVAVRHRIDIDDVATILLKKTDNMYAEVRVSVTNLWMMKSPTPESPSYLWSYHSYILGPQF